MHDTPFAHGYNPGDIEAEHRAQGFYDEVDDDRPTLADVSDLDEYRPPPREKRTWVKPLEELTTPEQRATLATLVAGGQQHGLSHGNLDGSLGVGTGSTSYRIHPDGRLERYDPATLTWSPA